MKAQKVILLGILLVIIIVILSTITVISQTPEEDLPLVSSITEGTRIVEGEVLVRIKNREIEDKFEKRLAKEKPIIYRIPIASQIATAIVGEPETPKDIDYKKELENLPPAPEPTLKRSEEEKADFTVQSILKRHPELEKKYSGETPAPSGRPPVFLCPGAGSGLIHREKPPPDGSSESGSPPPGPGRGPRSRCGLPL